MTNETTGTLKDAILSAIDKIPSVYAGTMGDDMGIGDVVAKEDVKQTIISALEATDAKRDARLKEWLRAKIQGLEKDSEGLGAQILEDARNEKDLAMLDGLTDANHNFIVKIKALKEVLSFADALDATANADTGESP
jgi:hypothetical protein